jgi:hypothetical protein
MSLDVDEMNRHDISKLTGDAGVVAVAPAMPMRLVEPIAPAVDAQPAAVKIEWGIKASRATPGHSRLFPARS